jgi:hypothetical protein
MGIVFIRMAQAEQDPAFATSLVPVGKGEWLVVRL